ncbi:accessory Sec system S-layer assembly protein [Aquibacillus salsiterrae]|uniref:Accessory Sec system S-layer assembly protein n=1 Tax=Aquibacillus salsiterrae TaxID=2950439 RepID=A0A9X4AE02_9BACI|nr:accessory Sec system S-layer assembly protein [Aquibacillus salsiterrae]MDC3416111.1 accessory Sec system S-layer assembly protein [Aquibacillus salsiterrae]
MFPFLRKNKEKVNKAVDDNAIDANQLFPEENDSDIQDSEEVDTELSFHPDWDIPAEERYVYAFHNSECAPLKPNQLSLYGIDIEKNGKNYVVTAFIRQTLSKDIKLKETPILLIGPDNQKLGRKVFDLEKAGVIPAKSSRPWQFIFTPNDLFIKDEIPADNWSLAFELKPTSRKNQLDLDESWKKSLADESIASLEKLVANATPLKPGEMNFMGISAKFNENRDLAVTILLRNGSEKNVYFEQIPLKVEDANGQLVAQGNFKLDKFEVKANTSKPWTFIFPQSLIQTKEPDLSKWKVYPVQ